MLRKWDDLPDFMRVDEVRPYWEILNRKRAEIFLKRLFDFVIGVVMLIVLIIPMGVIAAIVKFDSKGPVFYRQERVTEYGRLFRIHKFRTMIVDADKQGATVTISGDLRITRVGRFLRGCRLDELPQLIDIIEGNMSFVGTRPETANYVKLYKSEYYATLLLPAGVTSETSIRYRDEGKMFKDAQSIDIDELYIGTILPKKMEYNLESISEFRLLRDILTMIRTVLAVLGKKYN